MFIIDVLNAVLCTLARTEGESLVYLHLDFRRADGLQRSPRVEMQHSTSGCDVTAPTWARAGD